MSKAPTRKNKQGETEYWCRNCERWQKPKEWDGTGYTHYVCPDCDETFDDDPYGSWAYEKGRDKP